mmetsp:Transcript_35528/g.56876  ORF Transcript_35528/g.56876 Transcript_35528/m.56876 type:complete len:3214 (+) Transcript_35528:77-9718(+)
MFGLEAALLRVLEIYLGQYVESINKEQLKVGVLRGKIELKDVRLRRDALRGLGIPVVVQEGTVERLDIRVPWANLANEPVTIFIKGCSVHLVPFDPSTDGTDRTGSGEVEQKTRELKETRLKAAEVMALMENGIDLVKLDQQSSNGTPPKPSFRKKLLEKIFNNVFVKLEDVNLEYKLESSNVSLQVGGINVETVDPSSGEGVFFTQSSTAMQEDAPPLFLSRSIQVHDIVASCGGVPVLGPFEIEIVVMKALNIKAVKLAGCETNTSIFFTSLDWTASCKQMQTVIAVAGCLSVGKKLLKSKRNGRPGMRPVENPREWWRYATSLVTANKPKTRRTPFDLLEEISVRSAYIKLYVRKVELLKKGNAVERLTSQLSRYEKDLPFATILLYRKMAVRQAETDGESPKSRQSFLKSGSGSWIKRSMRSLKPRKASRSLPSIQQQRMYESILGEDETARGMSLYDFNRGPSQGSSAQIHIRFSPISFALVTCEQLLLLKGDIQGLEGEVCLSKSCKTIRVGFGSLGLFDETASNKVVAQMELDAQHGCFTSSCAKAFEDVHIAEAADFTSPARQRYRKRRRPSPVKPFFMDIHRVSIEKPQLFHLRMQENRTFVQFSWPKIDIQVNVLSTAVVQLYEIVLDAHGCTERQLQNWTPCSLPPSRQKAKVSRFKTLELDCSIANFKLTLPSSSNTGSCLQFKQLVIKNDGNSPGMVNYKLDLLGLAWVRYGGGGQVYILQPYNASFKVLQHLHEQENIIRGSWDHIDLSCDIAELRVIHRGICMLKGMSTPKVRVPKQRNVNKSKPVQVEFTLRGLHVDIHQDTKLLLQGVVGTTKLMQSKTEESITCDSLEISNFLGPPSDEEWNFQVLAKIPKPFKIALKRESICFDAEDCYFAWNHTLISSWLSVFQNEKYSLTKTRSGWRMPIAQQGPGTERTLAVNIPSFSVELHEEGLNRGLLRFSTRLLVDWGPNGKLVSLGCPKLHSTIHVGCRDIDVLAPFTPELAPENKNYDGSIEISFTKDLVKTSVRGINYIHYQNFIKEIMDYVEYGIKQPLAKLKSNKQREKVDKPGRTTLIELRRCMLSLPASRSVSQNTARHGKYQFRPSFCSILKKPDQSVFDIWFENMGISTVGHDTDPESIGVLFPQCEEYCFSLKWTRVRFTPEEAPIRKSLTVKGCDGIRSWCNNPSGNGFRNIFEFNLGDKTLELDLLKSQYNLFNIILSENFKDWRSCGHTCNGVSWANGNCPPPDQPCFCETLATETRVKELVFAYKFPKTTIMNLNLVGETSFRLVLEDFSYSITEFLRYGREGRYDVSSFRVEVSRLGPSQMQASTLLETCKPVRMDLEKLKTRDMTRTIYLDDLKMVMDIGSFKALTFFFEGNRNERVRMGCPVEYVLPPENLDPACHRAPKGTRRIIHIKNILLQLDYNNSGRLWGEGSVTIKNSRTKDQQRTTEMDARFTNFYFGPTDRTLLGEPLILSYHATKVPWELNTANCTRDVSLWVKSDISLSMDSLYMKHVLETVMSWRKTILKPGQRCLSETKRRYYETNPFKLTKLTSTLRMGAIQFTFLHSGRDDLKVYIPLISVGISPTMLHEYSETVSKSGRKISTNQLEFTEQSGGQRFGTGMCWCGTSEKRGVVAAYFNVRTAKWEPLLEPYVCQMKIQRTSNSLLQEPSKVAVKIESRNMLNVNFSHELCRTTCRVLAGLKHANVRPKRPSKRAGGCIVENCTGVGLRILANDPRTPMVQLADGETVEICFPDHLSIGWIKDSIASNWHEIHGIPLSSVGAFVYTLYPNLRGRREQHRGCIATQLVVEIVPEMDSTRVKLRSVFEFENQGGPAVDILLLPTSDPVTQYQLATDAMVLGPIPPGARCSLPLFASHCSLSVRPSTTSIDYAWWEGVDLRKVDVETAVKVNCASDDITFHAVLNVDVLQSTNSSVTRNLFVIELLPMLNFENLLPFQLCCRVSFGDDDMTEFCVESGQAHALYVGSIKGIMIKLPDAEWGPEEAVADETEVAVPFQSIFLTQKTLKTSPFSVNVCVYAPTWVLDQTGLGLCYAPDVNVFSENQSVQVLDASEEYWQAARIQKAGDKYDVLYDTGESECDVDASRIARDDDNSTIASNETPDFVDLEGTHDYLQAPSVALIELFSNKSMCVRMPGSEWSAPILLDSISSKTCISLEYCKKVCQVGVQVLRAPSIFCRTNVVAFVPRYVVVNRVEFKDEISPQLLIAQSHDTTVGDPILETVVSVDAGETRAFYVFHSETSKHMVCMSFKSSKSENWEWSGAFSLTHETQTAVKVRSRSSGLVYVFRLFVEMKQSTFFIEISLDTVTGSFYRIENLSSRLVHFFQDVGQEKREEFKSTNRIVMESSTNVAGDHEDDKGTCFTSLAKVDQQDRGIVERLFTGESRCFGWDQLNRKKLLVVLSLEADSHLVGCLFDHLNQKYVLRELGLKLDTYFDGSTKVLRLRDRGGQRAVVKSEKDLNSLLVQVVLGGVGVSVIDSTPQELLYISFNGVNFGYIRNPGASRTVELNIAWAQVDNQTHSAGFPVVLIPVLARHAKQQAPFLQLRAVEQNAENCRFFEYFGLALGEFSLNIELSLIARIWKLADSCMAMYRASKQSASLARTQSSRESTGRKYRLEKWVEGLHILRRSSRKRSNKMLYFGFLELHAIRANLTLQPLELAGEEAADVQQQQPIPRYTIGKQDVMGDRDDFDPTLILASLPRIVSDIKGAGLNLDALVLKNALFTPAQLIRRVQKHLSRETQSQIHQLIGASEVLGNPIGLVTDLGSGIRDFFLEPAQGLVESPEEFGAGLARGTQSFVQHTTVGTFGTAAKLSTSIGSGVAILSMDDRYLAQRRSSMLHEKPKHVGDGIMLGAKSLGIGLGYGLSGIVTEPIRGAEVQGVEGFFKGVGIGLLGVAVKPTVGVFDMIAQFLAGVKSTAAMLETSSIPTRIRLPRVMDLDQQYFSVYDPTAAFVQLLLLKSWGRRHENERPIPLKHIPLPGHLVVIQTKYCIRCVDYSCFASNLKTQSPLLLWQVDIRMVKATQILQQEEGHQLDIIISDPTSASCDTPQPGIQLLTDSAQCKLVLSGQHKFVSAIQEVIEEAMLRVSSELVVATSPRQAQRRNFGATLTPVPKTPSHLNALAKIFHADGRRGVALVTKVDPNSPASRTGILQGDYLVAVGGLILDEDDNGRLFETALAHLPDHSTLEILLWRNKKWLTKKVEF